MKNYEDGLLRKKLICSSKFWQILSILCDYIYTDQIYCIYFLRFRFKAEAEQFKNIEKFLEENNLKYTPVSSNVSSGFE